MQAKVKYIHTEGYMYVNEDDFEELTQLPPFFFLIWETMKMNLKTLENLNNHACFFPCCQGSTFLQLTNWSEKDLAAWKHVFPADS